jgi:hypothetical protein
MIVRDYMIYKTERFALSIASRVVGRKYSMSSAN